jgi:DNA polymerase/3'-5' exonuclease PolX
MNYADALSIAEDLRGRVEPVCEPGHALIVGSVRRQKHECHDLELLCKPSHVPYVPKMGDKRIFTNHLEKILFEMESEGLLQLIKGGDKMRQYWINTHRYELNTLNGFKAEFYIVTPPAQWGVLSLIRTGPGSEEDNFSRWCVTNRNAHGALPDGYKVRHGAVWTLDQLDSKMEPKRGETPLEMPTEQDFFDFLELKWSEPQYRHAPHNGRSGQ